MRFPSARVARTLRTLPLALALSLPFAGCDGCGSEGPGLLGTVTGTAEPAGPVAVTRSLAQRIPANVPAAMIVDDWNALSGSWRAIRPRLDALLGNMTMVENDVRNTLGFDPARPASLRDIGVNPDAGLAVVAWRGAAVVVVDLLDAPAFVARATQVLQGQPFRLRAPVRQSTDGRWAVHEFRRAEDGPVQMQVLIKDRTALVVTRPRTSEGIGAAFDAVTAENDLTTCTGFTSVLSAAEGYPVVGFLHGDRIASELAERAADDEVIRTWAQTFSDAGNIGFGLRPDGDAFTYTATWTPGASVTAGMSAVLGTGAAPTEFVPFIGDSTFFVARLSIDPSALWAQALRTMPAADRAAVETALAQVAETTGAHPVNDLVAGLGGNAILQATRVRPLTLRRVLESRNPAPNEVANAFGLMAAVELRERDRVDRFLTTLAAAAEGQLARFEADGAIVWQFTNPRLDIGNIVLLDRLAVVVPERERSDVLARLRAGGAGELGMLRDETARAFVRDAEVQGVHLDIRSIVTGPVGSALRPLLPEQANRALAELDLATMDLRREGETLRATGRLQFTAATPPAAAGE